MATAVATPLNAVIRDFVHDLQWVRRVSPHTVDGYRRDLDRFLDYCAKLSLSTLTPITRVTVQSFLRWEAEEGRGARTRARRLSALRTFFDWCRERQLLEDNPAAQVETPKLERRLPTTLSVDHALKLLEAPDVSSLLGYRDRTILELFYGSGLRVSELINLPLAGLKPEEAVLVIQGKRSKQRMVPLHKPGWGWLLGYIRDVRPYLKGDAETGIIFLTQRGEQFSRQGIHKLVKKYARQAGLPQDVYPHLLRHSFATHLLEGGVDLRSLQAMLGHAKLDTTEIYTHVADTAKRATFQQFHPRA